MVDKTQLRIDLNAIDNGRTLDIETMKKYSSAGHIEQSGDGWKLTIEGRETMNFK